MQHLAFLGKRCAACNWLQIESGQRGIPAYPDFWLTVNPTPVGQIVAFEIGWLRDPRPTAAKEDVCGTLQPVRRTPQTPGSMVWWKWPRMDDQAALGAASGQEIWGNGLNNSGCPGKELGHLEYQGIMPHQVRKGR